MAADANGVATERVRTNATAIQSDEIAEFRVLGRRLVIYAADNGAALRALNTIEFVLALMHGVLRVDDRDTEHAASNNEREGFKQTEDWDGEVTRFATR